MFNSKTLVLGIATTTLAVVLTGCFDSSVENNIDDLTVAYDKPNQQYSLLWNASAQDQPVTILVSETPEFTEAVMVVEGIQKNRFNWQPEAPHNRYYFKVQPEKGDAAVASSRWLPLQGGKNFRDLGGYITKGGEQIRWGKLLRAGALTGLTEHDHQELEELGVSTVIDFRTPEERQSEPTHWQSETTEIMSWDYDLGLRSFADVFTDPNVTAEKVEAAMAGLYPQILTHLKPQYTSMFDRLAASDEAMVFHCTAGKDRTGIAAAMILTVLGVDRDTIKRDFMLSDAYYSRMAKPASALGGVEKQAEAKQDSKASMMKHLPAEILQPLMGVRESYIQEAFVAMEAQSGSVMQYIQQELDVSDSEIQAIREHFLQPAL